MFSLSQQHKCNISSQYTLLIARSELWNQLHTSHVSNIEATSEYLLHYITLSVSAWVLNSLSRLYTADGFGARHSYEVMPWIYGSTVWYCVGLSVCFSHHRAFYYVDLTVYHSCLLQFPKWLYIYPGKRHVQQYSKYWTLTI